jgi:lambda family phage portal protein
MNNIDRIIEYISPDWATSRAKARFNLRAYEAAKPSRLHKLHTDRGSADSVVGIAGDSLRIQARFLDENHDLARGILNTLVNNIVGTGIRIEALAKDKKGETLTEFNNKLHQLFEDWMLKPEVTWELHWHQLQRLAARSWLRDGEVLLQLLEGIGPNLDHGTKIPFSLELIEADLLPMDFNDEKKNIIQGVKKNQWGKAIGYCLYKQHPGDIAPGLNAKEEYKLVPADNILHLKSTDRIRQTRGVSIFASVLRRLDDIKEYEEAERTAAKVAAAMCAFIRKSPDGPISSGKLDDIGNRLMNMRPGMIFDNLLPGEEIDMIESNRPNTMLEQFRNSQLRAVAAGTSTSFSSIAKDYNGTYSAQRQELVEQSIHYACLREHFVERFIRPIWQRFIRVSLLTDLIEMPKNIDMDTLLDADFRGPTMPWIDPLKEIHAEEKAVQAGFKSRSQVIRERGNNPAIVNEQIKRERAEEESADLVFTTNVGKMHEIKQTQEQLENE